MGKLYLALALLFVMPLRPQHLATKVFTIEVNHKVDLAWDETSTVDGFNVYRATSSGGAYSKLNSSLITRMQYVDASVHKGATYYYVVTAVSGQLESSYSNEAVVVVP